MVFLGATRIVEVRADETQFDAEIILCSLAVGLPGMEERVFRELSEGDIFSDGLFQVASSPSFYVASLPKGRWRSNACHPSPHTL